MSKKLFKMRSLLLNRGRLSMYEFGYVYERMEHKFKNREEFKDGTCVLNMDRDEVNLLLSFRGDVPVSLFSEMESHMTQLRAERVAKSN